MTIIARPAVSGMFQMFGFILLLLAAVLYSAFPVQLPIMWLGFLAGFSFYFLNALHNVRGVLGIAR